MTTRLEATAEAIAAAARSLALGNIVAFPTDTTYALGIRPDRSAAIDRLYLLKTRPRNRPLILLAASARDLDDWAEFPLEAKAYANFFWPGPLTLVLPAGPLCPDALRAGDGSIGVRVPDHGVAWELLRATGPLATTSANLTGCPSPRSADAVAATFSIHSERPAILLDGGPTRFELDSTVLALGARPRILRPGAISKAALERPGTVLSGG